MNKLSTLAVLSLTWLTLGLSAQGARAQGSFAPDISVPGPDAPLPDVYRQAAPPPQQPVVIFLDPVYGPICGYAGAVMTCAEAITRYGNDVAAAQVSDPYPIIWD